MLICCTQTKLTPLPSRAMAVNKERKKCPSCLRTLSWSLCPEPTYCVFFSEKQSVHMSHALQFKDPDCSENFLYLWIHDQLPLQSESDLFNNNCLLISCWGPSSRNNCHLCSLRVCFHVRISYLLTATWVPLSAAALSFASAFTGM